MGRCGGRGDRCLGCRRPDRHPHEADRGRDVARTSDAQGSAIPGAIRSARGQLAAAVPTESQGMAVGHGAHWEETGGRRSSACRSHTRCSRRAGAPVRAGRPHTRAAPGRRGTSWSQRTRGEIESRYRRSLVEREVGQQAGASKRRRPASARGQSSASTARWYSTRVASSRQISPRVLGGRSRVTRRRLLRMPYRFDRIRRLR
jgi:hypothetical protein